MTTITAPTVTDRAADVLFAVPEWRPVKGWASLVGAPGRSDIALRNDVDNGGWIVHATRVGTGRSLTGRAGVAGSGRVTTLMVNGWKATTVTQQRGASHRPVADRDAPFRPAPPRVRRLRVVGVVVGAMTIASV